jgi:hypothetical protein
LPAGVFCQVVYSPPLRLAAYADSVPVSGPAVAWMTAGDPVIGTSVRQAEKWLAVLSSVALAVVHVPSISHGGVHDATRQAIGPLQPIS